MMKVSLFYLPSVGSKADIEKGRVGLQGHLYDQMLHDITGQAKLADDLGYDSVSFTEHHFHIEGFELSNNPVLLGACPNSRCSILSESDSSLSYEQVFSPLEYRSDTAAAAECAGLRAERPCLAVYR